MRSITFLYQQKGMKMIQVLCIYLSLYIALVQPKHRNQINQYTYVVISNSRLTAINIKSKVIIYVKQIAI